MIRIDLSGYSDLRDWLKLRRSGIGGSDASVIVGMNRYRSQMELWLEKTNQLPIEEKETEVTYWGHTLESVIRNEFSKRSGLSTREIGFMYRSEEYPFMTANLDGEVDDPLYGTCIFEAKTASAFRAEEWQDGIPNEYYVQLQHYMAVTSYQGAYIAALIGGNTFLYRFIERDDSFIETLISYEAEFWHKVETLTMPEIDGSEATKKYLSELYPAAASKEIIDLGEAGAALVTQYDEVKAAEKEVERQKLLIENKLKEMMKDHEAAVAQGRQITWKNISSKRIDSKLLKTNKPELYEQYLYEVKSRRFEVAS